MSTRYQKKQLEHKIAAFMPNCNLGGGLEEFWRSACYDQHCRLAVALFISAKKYMSPVQPGSCLKWLPVLYHLETILVRTAQASYPGTAMALAQFCSPPPLSLHNTLVPRRQRAACYLSERLSGLAEKTIDQTTEQ